LWPASDTPSTTRRWPPNFFLERARGGFGARTADYTKFVKEFDIKGE
jgi:hypothetical protein